MNFNKCFLTSLLFIVLAVTMTSSFAADDFVAPYEDPSNDPNLNYTDEVYNDSDYFLLPTNLTHLDDDKIITSSGGSPIPSKYDLRDISKVSPVKDQNPIGTCWAFASIASLESCLLPGETWNFSENNIKNLLSNSYPEGFDRTYFGGGSSMMVLAYLARYSGPVLTSSDPYNPYTSISPAGLQPVKHFQQCIFIPGGDGPLDNKLIKMALMNYGAVSNIIRWNDSYYNGTSAAYYFTSAGNGTNHLICIVGWDDNYDKNNFLTPPPGNGAYIVKNSWGTGWGDDGYFYLSYYDFYHNYFLPLVPPMVFNGAEAITNYDQIYQYDPLGFVGNIGFNSNTPETAWFANKFTAKNTEALTAVSFYAPSTNAAYELFFTDGTNKYVLNKGTLTYPGYYTIKLNKTIPLIQGQNFFVLVKLTTPNYQRPIVIEYPMQNYSSKARANAGESFVSVDGNTWDDLTTKIPNANVCLKAFTVNTSKLVLGQSISDSTPQEGDRIQVSFSVRNEGPFTARGILVDTQIPSGLDFIGTGGGMGNFESDGDWEIPELQVGETATIILNFLVDDPGWMSYALSLSSETYNSNPENTSQIIIMAEPDDNPVNVNAGSVSRSYVNAGTVPMQNTGTSALPLLLALLLVSGGIFLGKKL